MKNRLEVTISINAICTLIGHDNSGDGSEAGVRGGSPDFTVVQPGQAGIPGLGPNKATYNDDIIEGWVGVGSQLDGLGHLGIEHVYYNGNKLLDFADPTGLKKLGIERSRRW